MHSMFYNLKILDGSMLNRFIIMLFLGTALFHCRLNLYDKVEWLDFFTPASMRPEAAL